MIAKRGKVVRFFVEEIKCTERGALVVGFHINTTDNYCEIKLSLLHTFNKVDLDKVTQMILLIIYVQLGVNFLVEIVYCFDRGKTCN